MKVTRRVVDPITFVERVSVECFPRTEDYVLDAQLGSSMSYLPRTRASSTTRLHVQENSLASEFRPPTPPKERGEDNPPRDLSLSPAAKRNLLKKVGGDSRSRVTKKPDISQLPLLSQIGENEEVGEGSMTELSLQLKSSHLLSPTTETTKKYVRFADEHELNYFTPMRKSVIAEIFWASSDLANFRYEAFMEEAGLDIEDYD
jgi:hypothetical protein